MFSYVSAYNKKKGYMTEVLCDIDNKNAVILSDQIRCVDFTLRKAEYITTVSDEIMSEVKAKIRALILVEKLRLRPAIIKKYGKC